MSKLYKLFILHLINILSKLKSNQMVVTFTHVEILIRYAVAQGEVSQVRLTKLASLQKDSLGLVRFLQDFFGHPQIQPLETLFPRIITIPDFVKEHPIDVENKPQEAMDYIVNWLDDFNKQGSAFTLIQPAFQLALKEAISAMGLDINGSNYDSNLTEMISYRSIFNVLIMNIRSEYDSFIYYMEKSLVEKLNFHFK